MIQTVASLCQKYQKAKPSVEVMRLAAVELTNSINNAHWISEWTKLEKKAKKDRGEALMIYNVASAPSKSLPVVHFVYCTIISQLTNNQ